MDIGLLANRYTRQRGDPAPSSMFFDLVILRLRQHPAVSYQHHAGQPERLLQLLDLIYDRFLVIGVSRVDIDSHRTSLGIGDHAVDDDGQSFLSIPIMTKARERAGTTFVVAAADVIEN